MRTTNYAMALLMPRPLLLSTSICLMDHGGLDRGPLFIRSVIFIECVVTLKWFLLSTWHLLLLSILERDPPLLLSWRVLPFSPVKGCLGVSPDPMWGQRSGMSICTDGKALWGKFVICENGLYKYNWTELNYSRWIWRWKLVEVTTLCPGLTCLLVTLVLAGVQEAPSAQLAEPRPAGILLVVQQDLRRVQPVRGVQLAPLQQDEPGSWRRRMEGGGDGKKTE